MQDVEPRGVMLVEILIQFLQQTNEPGEAPLKTIVK